MQDLEKKPLRLFFALINMQIEGGGSTRWPARLLIALVADRDVGSQFPSLAEAEFATATANQCNYCNLS